jgi:hypothetical protein
MKYAWIENNTVRDIANGKPVELFHPDIAAKYNTQVPDDIIAGATLIGGAWVNPTPIEHVEPVTPEPTVTEAPKVSPIEFKLLFTTGERIAIKTSTNPIVQDFYEITSDPRLTHVDLGLKSTKDAIAYLVSINILTQERADVILTGVTV